MIRQFFSMLFSLQTLRYASLVIIAMFYAIYAHKQHHFLAVVIEDALEAEITLFKKPWYFIPATGKTRVTQATSASMQPGLTKLVHFSGSKTLAVTVIDKLGNKIQEWPIDWFTLWPDASHLSYFMQPKTRPGTMVHGAEILPDGDLVFNFEYLGMMRLDPCGNVVWRLPYQTHHSIFIDENDFIWAPANKVRKNGVAPVNLHEPYYVEPFILKIAPDGTVVMEKSVMDILEANGMSAALYLSSIDNDDPVVKGDTLHLNDIEIFPATMNPGFFQPGDIMISLRNINTILILEPETWRIKHSISNLTLRQHDPDFIDGNTISVYDNNNRFYKNDNKAFSRIINIHLPDNSTKVIFQGNNTVPFFSKILGKQQKLQNGNLLVTESRGGRVLELSPGNQLIWEFNNMIDKETSAVVQEAERLPQEMDTVFFSHARKQCQNRSSVP